MSALSDMQKMILWCRKNGVSWTSLTVGTMTMEGADLKIAAELPEQKVSTEPRKSIQVQYGAALLEQAAESPGMDSVVQMDD